MNRRLAVLLPLLLLTPVGSRADALFQSTRPITACADARWVVRVQTDSQCFAVTPDQRWQRISTRNGLLLLRRTPAVAGEPPLYFRRADVTRSIPPAAAAEPAARLPITRAFRQAAAVLRRSRAHEGSDVGGLGLLFLLLAAGTAAGARAAYPRMKRNRALRIARAEIAAQQQALRIRRLQLVTVDHYGTEELDRWSKEKEKFCRTRIVKRLDSKGLSSQWPLISKKVDAQIERSAAKTAITGERRPKQFQSDPQVFHPNMDPLDYERHCALLLRRSGWDARATGASGDQGTDVIAHRNGKYFVLQCKLYNHPVGNNAVQQASAARLHQRADWAAVVSNANFTTSARQLAETNSIYLLHHEQLQAFDPVWQDQDYTCIRQRSSRKAGA